MMDAILFAWPYVGLVLALLLVLGLALERRAPGAPPRHRDPAFILPLLWPMYLVHQFEEHGIDALGRSYAFLADMCAVLGHGGDLAGCPADPAFIFAVNVVACPLAFALPFVFRRTRPLVAACGWGIPIVNAVAHIGGAVARGAYNPGLLTSLVLFAPLCGWTLHLLLGSGAITRAQLPRVVASGVGVHAVLMGSLILRERGVIGHGVLLAVNGASGLLPLVFGRVGVKEAGRAAESVTA